MKLEVIKSVTPYIYAGAVRSGTSHAVEGVRIALGKATETHPAVSAFLSGPTGEALLRLALAGALSVKELPALAGLQDDVKQELLVSAAAGGCDVLLAALTDGGKFLWEQLGSAGGAIVEVAPESSEQ